MGRGRLSPPGGRKVRAAPQQAGGQTMEHLRSPGVDGPYFATSYVRELFGGSLTFVTGTFRGSGSTARGRWDQSGGMIGRRVRKDSQTIPRSDQVPNLNESRWGPWRRALSALRRPPVATGGVVVYRVSDDVLARYGNLRRRGL